MDRWLTVAECHRATGLARTTLHRLARRMRTEGSRGNGLGWSAIALYIAPRNPGRRPTLRFRFEPFLAWLATRPELLARALVYFETKSAISRKRPK
jgi:hypothetical protein